VVYPNSGREWDAVKKVWIGNQSSAFTDSQLEEWRKLGAGIIGGCCGVGPKDIKEIGQNLLK
jgi:homocysteine S-methyltransferase